MYLGSGEVPAEMDVSSFWKRFKLTNIFYFVLLNREGLVKMACRVLTETMENK